MADASLKKSVRGSVRFDRSPTTKTHRSSVNSLDHSPSKLSHSPSKVTDYGEVPELDLETLKLEVAKAKKEEQAREREEAEQRAKVFNVPTIHE